MESRFIAFAVNKYIQDMITEVKQKIREEGLHRWVLKDYENSYSADNPTMFSVKLLLHQLYFGGVDNFEARNVSYDSPTTSIRFEVVIPQLILRSGLSTVTVKLFDQDLISKFDGWVGVKNIIVICKAKMVMEEISGFKLENWDIALDVDSIASCIKCSVLGMDFSDTINNFLGVKLVELIKLYGDKAKDILENIFQNFGGAQPDFNNCLGLLQLLNQ